MQLNHRPIDWTHSSSVSVRSVVSSCRNSSLSLAVRARSEGTLVFWFWCVFCESSSLLMLVTHSLRRSLPLTHPLYVNARVCSLACTDVEVDELLMYLDQHVRCGWSSSTMFLRVLLDATPTRLDAIQCAVQYLSAGLWRGEFFLVNTCKRSCQRERV
jgi:hypothetical protein